MSDATIPAALLLDLGGVLVDVRDRPHGIAEASEHVHTLIARSSGVPLEPARVQADLCAGLRAYREWKHAEGRRPRPREIGYREFWEKLVAADWPRPARSAVVSHAAVLCEMLDVVTKDRVPNDGALELLRRVASLGIRCGIVSNALGADRKSVV